MVCPVLPLVVGLAVTCIALIVALVVALKFPRRTPMSAVMLLAGTPASVAIPMALTDGARATIIAALTAWSILATAGVLALRCVLAYLRARGTAP